MAPGFLYNEALEYMFGPHDPPPVTDKLRPLLRKYDMLQDALSNIFRIENIEKRIQVLLAHGRPMDENEIIILRETRLRIYNAYKNYSNEQI